MRKFGLTFISTLFLSLFILGTALASDKGTIKKTVNITEDVLIGDTLVKKGTYTVKFDAQNNEITFFSDNKVIAKAKATTEQSTAKSPYTSLTYTTHEKGKKLSRLAFEGERRTVILNEGAMTTSSSE